MKKVFLSAEWRKLAIVNYAVAPQILIPYLPYKTELDFWKEKCYVSLIGFRFINTKLKGIPVPFHCHFEEINLRFYVKYKAGNTWRRGVTFIKEIVPKPALTFVANALYGENYITLPTKHNWELKEQSIIIGYQWKHLKQWDELRISAKPERMDILPGSEEEFITEHYWGYTRKNESETTEYQVEHPGWKMYPVNDYKVNVRFGELYGSEFEFLSKARPDSFMLAEGSEIEVGDASLIS